MVQTMYEIRVAGVVPEEDLRDMGAVTIAPEQVNPVLYGVSDQAALYGLLDRLRALGVAVVEVRRVPSPSLGEDLEDAVEGEVSDELDD
jgi:hypothetical protein